MTDPVIAEDTEESQMLLEAVADHTKHHCCTTILLGFFAASIEPEALEDIFKHYFDVKWKPAGEPETYEAHLVASDQSLLRTTTLVPKMIANAVWLVGVPPSQAVYFGPTGRRIVYAAFMRVGLGKLGYIGDTGFGDEPERLALAMCHLDRPEDNIIDGEEAESQG